MKTNLGIFGDTMVCRVVSIDQIQKGQYGLYGSARVVVKNKTKNPQHIPNTPTKPFIYEDLFYFLDIGGIKSSLKNGLAVGDVIAVNYEVGQFTKQGDQFPTTVAKAKMLLTHTTKVEIECLKANGLIQVSQNQNQHRCAAPQQRASHLPQQPQQNGNWGSQPA